MNKKNLILGAALRNGLTRTRLQKLTGMSPATFSRRMADPDTITIGELRRIDQLARFEDADLLKIVRSK